MIHSNQFLLYQGNYVLQYKLLATYYTLTLPIVLPLTLRIALLLALPSALSIVSRLVLCHLILWLIQIINFVQLWLLIMRLMKLILIYPCLCPPIQIFLCPFIVIVLQGSSLSTTHSYIITILLGSKLFFKFCNF